MKPGLQLATVQVPVTHAGVPFVTAHATLHAPQLSRSVAEFTSQPLLFAPSQLRHEPWHVPTPHEPELQTASACESTQSLPHAPQLFESVSVFFSQPSDASPLQFE